MDFGSEALAKTSLAGASISRRIYCPRSGSRHDRTTRDSGGNAGAGGSWRGNSGNGGTTSENHHCGRDSDNLFRQLAPEAPEIPVEAAERCGNLLVARPENFAERSRTLIVSALRAIATWWRVDLNEDAGSAVHFLSFNLGGFGFVGVAFALCLIRGFGDRFLVHLRFTIWPVLAAGAAITLARVLRRSIG